MAQHTKDKLAAELRKLGLEQMALRADAGYYDDYLSPVTNNIGELLADLAGAAVTAPDDNAVKILSLRQRVINGDFDGTTEESEAWAASPEGKAALRSLIRHKND